MRALATVVLVIAVAALAPAAGARPTHECGNGIRTDQSLMTTPTGSFGIFGIHATGTTCAKARTVAAAWYLHEHLLPNPGKPYTAVGYRCTTSAKRAQELIAACVRHDAHIGFRWELPSG